MPRNTPVEQQSRSTIDASQAPPAETYRDVIARMVRKPELAWGDLEELRNVAREVTDAPLGARYDDRLEMSRMPAAEREAYVATRYTQFGPEAQREMTRLGLAEQVHFGALAFAHASGRGGRSYEQLKQVLIEERNACLTQLEQHRGQSMAPGLPPPLTPPPGRHVMQPDRALTPEPMQPSQRSGYGVAPPPSYAQATALPTDEQEVARPTYAQEVAPPTYAQAVEQPTNEQAVEPPTYEQAVAAMAQRDAASAPVQSPGRSDYGSGPAPSPSPPSRPSLEDLER